MGKIYYTFSEVCNELAIKPHILRYWETEFIQLKKKFAKNSSRRYDTKDLELVKKIKELIYVKKYTYEGAKSELKKRRFKKYIAELKKESPSLKDELLEIKSILLQCSSFLDKVNK